ncbi:hypothetical protein [Nocardiopsis sp. RV163]|nr:hypothetical protein [Nocardiopsis sp. RV163]
MLTPTAEVDAAAERFITSLAASGDGDRAPSADEAHGATGR